MENGLHFVGNVVKSTNLTSSYVHIARINSGVNLRAIEHKVELFEVIFKFGRPLLKIGIGRLGTPLGERTFNPSDSFSLRIPRISIFESNSESTAAVVPKLHLGPQHE